MTDTLRSKHFPAELIPGITAKSVTAKTFTEVWQTLSAQVETPFAELGNYVMPEARQARATALQQMDTRTHREQVVFYTAADEPIGWSSGAMLDPGTFFMAYSAVLPGYQRRGIYSAFLRMFLPYLYALGYERVSSNHMVNNRAVLIAKLKAGFVVTGIVLDERYGAQVSLTHLFHEDRRSGFAHTYSLENYADMPDYR